MYQQSYVNLIVLLILIIAVTIGSLLKRKKFNSYKFVMAVLFSGILWLILSCIANSLAFNHWDKEFIVDFLLLKKGWWLFSASAAFGYAHFVWGAIVFFLTKQNKRGG